MKFHYGDKVVVDNGNLFHHGVIARVESTSRCYVAGEDIEVDWYTVVFKNLRDEYQSINVKEDDLKPYGGVKLRTVETTMGHYYVCAYCGFDVTNCTCAVYTPQRITAYIGKPPNNESHTITKMNAVNDEELARLFYNAVMKHGLPRIPEGAYGSGESSTFEDLSLRDVKQMAAFVREIKK